MSRRQPRPYRPFLDERRLRERTDGRTRREIDHTDALRRAGELRRAFARRNRRRRVGGALLSGGIGLAALHLVRRSDEVHLFDQALADAVVGLPLVALVVLFGAVVLGRMGPADRD